MASFLTLVSRYLSKKKAYREKQEVKTEKEKKQKVATFAKQKPDHANKLKAWEKAYGEKKQDADAKFNEKRKKRIMKARAMGPSARKSTYRSASIYMAKDPFTKKPSERAAKVKSSAGLTKRGRKKEQEIRKYFAPQQIKESAPLMPAIRGIPQSLIDSVIKAQQTQEPPKSEKPLDLSLKVADTKQPVTETKRLSPEEKEKAAKARADYLKQFAADRAKSAEKAWSITGFGTPKSAIKEDVNESAIGWFRSKKRAIGKAVSGSVEPQRERIKHGLVGQMEKNAKKPDGVLKNVRADDLKTRAKYVSRAGTKEASKRTGGWFNMDSLVYSPMSGKSSMGSDIKSITRSTHKISQSMSRMADSLKTSSAKVKPIGLKMHNDYVQKLANAASKKRSLARKAAGIKLQKEGIFEDNKTNPDNCNTVNPSRDKGAASSATPASIKKKVNENKADHDAKFSNDMVKHHEIAARVAHAKGDFKKRDEHLSKAMDYKNFGTTGLAGFDPREEVVMEGAKKMKLKPGMSAKEFKAAKQAFAAKKAAKKVKPKTEAPAPKPAAADEDEGMLGKILKGKLPAGDFHPGSIRGAITSFARPAEKLEFQKKLWKAKSPDEVTALLKSRK